VDKIIAIPIFIFLYILQTSVFGRITLVHGVADVILLTLIAWGLNKKVESASVWALIAGSIVSFASALPYMIPLFSFLVITFITKYLQRRVWQMPMLAMVVSTIIGTVIYYVLSIIGLKIIGSRVSWIEGLTLVMLPSIILNIVVSLPVFLIVNDLAELIYKDKVVE